jgi:TctA family transporter
VAHPGVAQEGLGVAALLCEAPGFGASVVAVVDGGELAAMYASARPPLQALDAAAAIGAQLAVVVVVDADLRGVEVDCQEASPALGGAVAALWRG